ncbi:undecaprenyldiphospho-muramoylpentapeptide beta-N-acetylglucosaminyltransferase [Thiotrichales bacterium 19S3-7]|nr:undecaprenyldiphospho-muramoylpentapeptide beta-N-acetylglucosaminyltransferase [Thiotrichales bacterium 19S3-7]MCF6801160.1 undecaprenyldiphospho-muramoylpentapeptide beta-N-acetylglucosaminyltransferase [Thiotrichales bacterium 19S3-11]
MKNEMQSLKHKRIMILAGGTGGHIFPAITVSERLEEQGCEIFWLGTEKGLEKKLIQGRFHIDYIQMKGLRNKGLLRYLIMPITLFKSIIASIRVVRRHKIDLVLGFGGYIAAPGGLAAKLLFKPLIIHEQNARSGLTNRLLAKLANNVLSAFEVPKLSRKLQVIGNPLRSEVLAVYNEDKVFSDERPYHILVTGGSQGAQIFNQLLPEVFSKLSQKKSIIVRHQSGLSASAETSEQYQKYQVNAQVIPFITDIADTYRWADIIICRAGALTVSEVAACGIPAVFIPYPYAVDDHQYYNAQALVNAEAAVCIRQEAVSIEALTSILTNLLQSKEVLIEKSTKAKAQAQIKATEMMLEIVNKSLSKGSS